MKPCKELYKGTTIDAVDLVVSLVPQLDDFGPEYSRHGLFFSPPSWCQISHSLLTTTKRFSGTNRCMNTSAYFADAKNEAS